MDYIAKKVNGIFGDIYQVKQLNQKKKTIICDIYNSSNELLKTNVELIIQENDEGEKFVEHNYYNMNIKDFKML